MANIGALLRSSKLKQQKDHRDHHRTTNQSQYKKQLIKEKHQNETEREHCLRRGRETMPRRYRHLEVNLDTKRECSIEQKLEMRNSIRICDGMAIGVMRINKSVGAIGEETCRKTSGKLATSCHKAVAVLHVNRTSALYLNMLPG